MSEKCFNLKLNPLFIIFVRSGIPIIIRESVIRKRLSGLLIAAVSLRETGRPKNAN